MNLKKRQRKRRYTNKERFDVKRKKLGIPADASPVLLSHRRGQYAAALAAKAPCEPRIVQRRKRLEEKAAAKQRQDEIRKSITERLGLSAAAA